MFIQNDGEILVALPGGHSTVLTLRKQPGAIHVEVEGKPSVQTWPTIGPTAVLCDMELALIYEAELSS